MLHWRLRVMRLVVHSRGENDDSTIDHGRSIGLRSCRSSGSLGPRSVGLPRGLRRLRLGRLGRSDRPGGHRTGPGSLCGRRRLLQSADRGCQFDQCQHGDALESVCVRVADECQQAPSRKAGAGAISDEQGGRSGQGSAPQHSRARRHLPGRRVEFGPRTRSTIPEFMPRRFRAAR